MARKPTPAGGYVAASNVALMGVHYAQGDAVSDLSEPEIKRALAHGWIRPADPRPEPAGGGKAAE